MRFVASLLMAALSLPVFAIEDGEKYLPPSMANMLSKERLEKAYEEGTLTEQERRAVELAREIAKQGTAPEIPQEALDIAATGVKRGREVINEAMLKERESVMRLMGLDPAAKGKLYIMVSASMSDSLIQAYAREAMWSGAVLVVRGLPPGVTLKQYLKERVAEWVRNKGATAMVDIDPRPFSMYEVKMVPTIVYTEVQEEDLIGVCSKDPEAWGGVSFSKCKPLDPNLYWKLEGGVTLAWALDRMVSSGAAGAQRYLDALAKAGFSSRSSEQRPFEGNWAEAPTPQELADMNRRLGASGLEAYLMPQGVTAVGPAGMKIEQPAR